MKTFLLPSTCSNRYFEFKPSWDNFRAYTFSFLIYQEWKHLPDVFFRLKHCDSLYYGVSPLHDKDILENGLPDKPHYHCVVRFENARSAYKLARDLLLTCRVFKTESFKGSIRYFIHLDNPEKFQYDRYQILTSDWEITAAQFNTVWTKENSDIATELMFIKEIRSLIKRHFFEDELQIADYVISNGFGRYFNKYKYQLHGCFIQYCIPHKSNKF